MAGSSKESKELKERRAKQLTQISEAVLSLESCQSSNRANQEKFGVLDSVLEGMYEEIEKLTKKKPVEVATELMVEQINDVIQEAQKLITDDAYIEKLRIFVAAGDQPELQDVLFVLRQLRQGMQRFGKKLERENLGGLLLEAGVVKIALEIFERDYLPSDQPYFAPGVEEIETLLKLETHSGLLQSRVPDCWATGGTLNKRFDFDRLDYIEIEDYFRLS